MFSMNGDDADNDGTSNSTTLIQHNRGENRNRYIYNINDRNYNNSLYFRDGYAETENSIVKNTVEDYEMMKLMYGYKQQRYWWSELKELCIPTILGYLTYQAVSTTTEIVTIPASALIQLMIYIPIYIYGSFKDIVYSILTLSVSEYGYYRDISLKNVESVINTSILSLGIPISLLFGIGMYLFVFCLIQLMKLKKIRTPLLEIEYKD